MNRPLMFINNTVIVEQLKQRVWDDYKNVRNCDFEGWYIGLSPIEKTAWEVKFDEIQENERRQLQTITSRTVHRKFQNRREWIVYNKRTKRTPLGGFVNHNTIANCELYQCGAYLRMKTSKDIKVGGELTLAYNLYDPCKNYVDAND